MKKTIVVVLAALLSGFAAGPVSADTGYTYERTALRTGPGRNYKVLAYIPEGAKIDMRACKDGWCRVRWNGKSGYASYGSIDYEDDYEDCVYFGICL